MIYGRPSVARNAFTLIVEALRSWVWLQPNVSEWEITSAGEQHNDIELGNSITIRSRGKMSLEDYANELKESAVGISLMISPHPSYPPLEMAHFGMLVLTNSYENKDLSALHNNIRSVGNLSPYSIAKELKNLCDEFEGNNSVGESKGIQSYLDDTEQFDFVKRISY